MSNITLAGAHRKVRQSRKQLARAIDDARQRDSHALAMRRAYIKSGLWLVGSTAVVRVATLITGGKSHSWWYYVPTFALGLACLVIAVMSTIFHRKYQRMIADARKEFNEEAD